MRGDLHRLSPRRVAQRQTCGPMERDAFHLRLSDHWCAASAGDRHWPCAQGAGTDLEGKARNGEPFARAFRKHFGPRQGARLPRRRKPRALARTLGQAAAATFQGAPSRTHAFLPCAELPGFLVALREQEGIAAYALEFLTLTAARTSEVIGARWREMNLLDKTWTVPATRMKARREHRIPLSARTLDILKGMHGIRSNDDPDTFVFTGRKPGTPLSNMAFLMLMRRMGRGDLTAHGFRATFKTWASECT